VEVPEHPTSLYTIRNVRTLKIQKFRTNAEDYLIIINEGVFRDSIPEILHTLHQIFEQLINDILGDDRENIYARFIMRSPYLDKPISVGMTHHTNLTAHKILSAIERVLMSRDLFLLDGNLLINFIYTRAPSGKGRYKPKSLKIEDMVKNKRSIISICNKKDTLCLGRALYVAKVYCDNSDHSPTSKNFFFKVKTGG
jgi:hypothetical protein